MHCFASICLWKTTHRTQSLRVFFFHYTYVK
jgi:hypothetical protein